MLDSLKFNADGLIPAIVQDASNNQVLMMAWMNRESLEQTIQTGRATYWSRSRQQFWIKGESSGHTQAVRRISVDCDMDTLLLWVDQVGAACHDNYRSCFYRDLVDGELRTNAEPVA
jgi:phosphoribosyl-AMP cyclohydrolase